jgi:hypothetical protein
MIYLLYDPNRDTAIRSTSESKSIIGNQGYTGGDPEKHTGGAICL